MGLSGPKKRTKLSSDPNNTTWSNNSSNYGHKILTQQGWSSGQYLGAKDASHAAHYTAANASHIRVALREDGLGLGAKRGAAAGGADTFGLSTLAGIFGRLNGKGNDVLEREEEQRRDVGLRLRYGVMGFVSGGLLVGDRMLQKEELKLEDVKQEGLKQEDLKDEDAKQEDMKQEDIKQGDVAEQAGKSKKRKVKNGDLQGQGDEEKRSKRVKTESDPVFRTKTVRSTSKRKRTTEQNDAAAESENTTAVEVNPPKRKKSKAAEESNPVSQAKLEKRARKEERRKRREGKAEKRQAAESESASKSISGSATPVIVEIVAPDPPARTETAVPAPAPSQLLFGGRHAVRQRYIQQKRMASMDSRAMQEILMLKSGA